MSSCVTAIVVVSLIQRTLYRYLHIYAIVMRKRFDFPQQNAS